MTIVAMMAATKNMLLIPIAVSMMTTNLIVHATETFDNDALLKIYIYNMRCRCCVLCGLEYSICNCVFIRNYCLFLTNLKIFYFVDFLHGFVNPILL